MKTGCVPALPVTSTCTRQSLNVHSSDPVRWSSGYGNLAKQIEASSGRIEAREGVPSARAVHAPPRRAQATASMVGPRGLKESCRRRSFSGSRSYNCLSPNSR